MARILILCGSDPWTQTSGYFVYSSRIIELLCRNHQVAVASLYRPATDHLPPPRQVARYAFSNRRKNPALQRFRSIFGIRSFCELEFGCQTARRWIEELLARERPEIVVFNHIRSAWLAIRMPRSARRTVYIAHNAEAISYRSIAQLEGNPFGKAFARLEAVKLAALEREVVCRVDCTIALTDEDAQRLRGMVSSAAIAVVPPCLDVPTSIGSYEPSCNKIVIVGSFFWRPKRANVKWFVKEVYWRLLAERKDLECRIIGANARSLADFVGYGVGITLHSDVPSVEPYLREESVFVTPERQWGGVKLKTCEAALYGRPIVSTAPGIEGTGLRNEESCLVADTAPHLLRSISRCLDDFHLRQSIGQSARRVARERFAPAAISERLNQVISSLTVTDSR